RTQQLLAHESGAATTVDPLAGSHYVETLTAQLEERARQYLVEIEERGGAAASLAYMVDEIQRAAYAYQLEIEAGERIVVGVNAHLEDEPEPRIDQPAFPQLETRQRDRLEAIRKRRDAAAVRRALQDLSQAADGTENLLPLIVAAVKRRATLGEISGCLRQAWGEYHAIG
ncbi:MAG: methylmalonyl-CoA mutase family protein, partial [Gemmatimonadales bacterium]